MVLTTLSPPTIGSASTRKREPTSLRPLRPTVSQVSAPTPVPTSAAVAAAMRRRIRLDQQLGECEVGSPVQREPACDQEPGEAQGCDRSDAAACLDHPCDRPGDERDEHPVERRRHRQDPGRRDGQQRTADQQQRDGHRWEQVGGERVRGGRPPHGRTGPEDAVVGAVEDALARGAGETVDERLDARSGAQGEQTERDDEHAQAEGDGEPMPQGELDARARSAELDAEHLEERRETRRQWSEHESRRGQQECGELEADRSMVGLGAHRTEERPADVAQRVGDRPDAREHDEHEAHRPEPGAARDALHQRGEGLLLRDEPEQRGEAGHRHCGERPGRSGEGECMPQASEAIEVTRPGLMIDDADRHEQRGLEQRVGEDVDRCDAERERRAEPHECGHEPQLADRRVRHEPLEVALNERDPRPQDGGRATDEDEADVPDHEPVEGGRHAEDQVDAGLHHRRGMQVGGDGCRCDHRPGEPEVERDLRGLRARGEQQQDDGRDRERGALDGCRLRRDHAERRAAHGGLDEDRGGQQCESSDPRHEQRTRRTLRALPGPADEEEARDARQLPCDEQQEDVVGEYDAEHRAREEREQCRDPHGVGIVVGEVPQRIGHHQHADEGDDEREDERERVKAQVE